MAPLSSGIAELIARTVCAFSLGYLFGYKGVCYATPMAWLAAAIVLYVGYKMSLKKQLSILKGSMTLELLSQIIKKKITV